MESMQTWFIEWQDLEMFALLTRDRRVELQDPVLVQEPER